MCSWLLGISPSGSPCLPLTFCLSVSLICFTSLSVCLSLCVTIFLCHLVLVGLRARRSLLELCMHKDWPGVEQRILNKKVTDINTQNKVCQSLLSFIAWSLYISVQAVGVCTFHHRLNLRCCSIVITREGRGFKKRNNRIGFSELTLCFR